MVDYLALLKQYPFVEQKKPAPKAAPGQPIEIEDYTTEKQLKAMFLKVKPRDEFLVAQEAVLGLSAAQFWEKYYKDDAENGFDKFMEAKGE